MYMRVHKHDISILHVIMNTPPVGAKWQTHCSPKTRLNSCMQRTALYSGLPNSNGIAARVHLARLPLRLTCIESAMPPLAR